MIKNPCLATAYTQRNNAPGEEEVHRTGSSKHREFKDREFKDREFKDREFKDREFKDRELKNRQARSSTHALSP